MQIYWQSFGDFLAMGGYAPFVWGAYGVTALLIALEIFLLVRGGRTPADGAGRSPQPGEKPRG
ncbi:MAG TPA: heme exporter protein CcmD [Burkholderiales bacterium]|jgi:heme exporter protein CcmD|nr:heme exporter protein CcmD [Burkholderiales bacterium]